MDVLFSPPVFSWWFLLFGLGLLFLPLTRRLFPHAADAAYPFAKILALALTSYPIWLLSSLKLLPFSASPVWLLLIPAFLTIILSVFHFPLSHPLNPPTNPKSQDPKTPRPQTLPLIIFEEFLFTLTFFFWLFVRAHEPSLQSLEKPMDFGIINSLLRADSFPPKDMWLSGFNLNYYYYGHFVVALLIKITGVLPEVGYNLMLATLFALTFTAAFSFSLNLFQNRPLRKTLRVAATRRVEESAGPSLGVVTGPQIIIGLLTAFGVSLAGNLHPLYALLKGASTYWYPDATRFIERTIHEFPGYSFVVADLHGHLLDVPFVLLTIFLLKEIFLKIKPEGSATRPFGLTRETAVYQALLGILLAILYMTNSADALIYGALFFLLLFFSSPSLKVTPFQGVTFSIYKIWRPALVTFLLSLASAAPFLLTFQPFIEGLSLATEHSPFWQLLVLWGGFLPFVLGFLFYFLRRSLKTLRVSVNPQGLPADQDAFLVLLIIFSLLLTIFPEIFYFKDIYTTQPRANTLFKFSYQTFILFSLVTPYSFVRIINFWEKQRVRKLLWSLIFTATLIATSTYPFFAVRGFYGELGTPKTLTLNGLEYLRQTSPDDYQVVVWLKNSIKGQPTIIEAVGESYTAFARISANTGLPAVLGWPVHEWLWRQGNGFRELREPEITDFYQTKDEETAKKLLNKYQVKYVMVGQLEKERYPNLNEEKFKKLGMVAFASGESRLYKIF